jgi:hypothetical protein
MVYIAILFLIVFVLSAGPVSRNGLKHIPAGQPSAGWPSLDRVRTESWPVLLTRAVGLGVVTFTALLISVNFGVFLAVRALNDLPHGSRAPEVFHPILSFGGQQQKIPLTAISGLVGLLVIIGLSVFVTGVIKIAAERLPREGRSRNRPA